MEKDCGNNPYGCQLPQQVSDLQKQVEKKAERCPDCDGTGFLGDQCAGVIGNTEFYPCECGIVNQPYVDLAEMTHQAHRNQGLLESIWNAIYPKSDYEYLGQVSTHTIQILQEHKDKIAKLKAQVAEKDRVIEVLLDMMHEYCTPQVQPAGYCSRPWKDRKLKQAEAKAKKAGRCPSNCITIIHGVCIHCGKGDETGTCKKAKEV